MNYLKRSFLYSFIIVFSVFLSQASFAAPAAFIPEQPVMPASRLRPGMRGYALTVLKGTKPARLPVEIVSVIPRKDSAKNAVLIRVLPSSSRAAGSFAQGMSGSPVFIDDRLVGAIGTGWNFSDHKTALVTPIEAMRGVFSHPDAPKLLKSSGQEKTSDRASDLFLSSSTLTAGGLSQESALNLGERLGVPLESVPWDAAGDLPVKSEKFRPGDAISVLLAWGDVEISATGTVTATSKDGRFLAFGHPFLNRGAVNFPVGKAYIHDIVSSRLFPFKLASPLSLTGTATQDRNEGIGGRMGYFTPSIPATLTFLDLDAGNGKRTEKKFRMAPDETLGPKLLEGIYKGLLDDQWQRRGQGTLMVTLRVEGQGMTEGWTRTNMFFSENDASSVALRESAAIMELFLRQPFREIFPVGFRLDVSATQEPKILLIEDVNVSSDVKPGDTLDVEVTLRPWRRSPVKKKFELTVPKDVTGVCELVVRGGGINSLTQTAIEGGWKSIDGFARMMKEISAVDANNELIVELLHDRIGSLEDRQTAKEKKSSAELLPEEKEFLSETKARRIKEGTLRISRSEYVVDGIMKRVVNVAGEN